MNKDWVCETKIMDLIHKDEDNGKD